MDMQFGHQGSFAPVYSFQPGQTMQHYSEGQYRIHPGFPHGLSYMDMFGYHQPRNPLMGDHAGLVDGKTESKPRLTKEEVDRLEKEFRKNPKPSSSVKAQLADSLRLERARINNWFQNRRAKAKQEKKQEEYEARRAAEQDPSESASPQEYSLSESAAERANDSGHHRMQPSSALFPDVSASSHESSTAAESTCEEDESCSPEEPRSPHAHQPYSHKDDSSTVQSQMSDNFTSSGMMAFSEQRVIGDFSNHAQTDELESSFNALNQNLGQVATSQCDGLATPDTHSVESGFQFQFQNMVGGYNSSTATTFPLSQSSPSLDSMETSSSNNSVHGHGEHPHNIPSPADSFKSPPPPANIASRRNIPRPAALQAAALRNYPNVPRTAMDGLRRLDHSKQPLSLRRIHSSNGPGRIQKSSAGPRSPINMSKQEAWIHQYQHGGPMTAPFSMVAPPTPRTPIVMKQQSLQDLVVASSSADDDSMIPSSAVHANFLSEFNAQHNLKTPPQSPGVIGNFGTSNLIGNPFSSYPDFIDQPVMTPFGQEFPGLQGIPDYVNGSDGSSPSTPQYAHGSSGPLNTQGAFLANAPVKTEFDWDTNESVVSSRSSPGQFRSKQVQFAKNVTPNDWPQSQQH